MFVCVCCAHALCVIVLGVCVYALQYCGHACVILCCNVVYVFCFIVVSSAYALFLCTICTCSVYVCMYVLMLLYDCSELCKCVWLLDVRVCDCVRCVTDLSMIV